MYEMIGRRCRYNETFRCQKLVCFLLGDTVDTPAVTSVSFSISKGEVLALVGESGSGKSTIAQTVLRILPPPGVIVGGDILFKGESVLSMDARAGQSLRWSQISMVFQSALNALNPTMSIAGHFQDTLRHRGIDDQDEVNSRMMHWLKMTELQPSCASLFPHQLSGGMRQRVVIALALILEPDLVIFDEATTALDVVVEQDIMNRIMALQRKMGFAALFITHDLNLMCRIADRVGVMRNGQLLETLSRDRFLQDAQHPYTKQLIDSLPKLEERRSDRLETNPKRELLLKAVGISKQFDPGGWFRQPGPVVVQDLNFPITQGEVLALVGESGSGKSTIGRMVCGLHDPTSGHFEWSIDSPRIQMIFQDPYGALNAVHTIGRHLSRPLILSKSTKTVASLLEAVGLSPSDALKYPHELSGGQRQRVCIARALAGEPDLIVADEPTAMLDVAIRQEVLTLLERLRREMGISFLFITHDLTAAATFSDQIYVLQSGQVVESGHSSDVLFHPKSPYTQALLNAAAHPEITQENHIKGEQS